VNQTAPLPSIPPRSPAWAGDACSDLELVERMRHGDARAFESLVRQYGPRMMTVARRMLGCESESADALQDAFLSAFRSLDSFRGDCQLPTWLHRIVVNACLMRLRCQRRRPAVRMADVLPKFDDTGHHAAAVVTWRESPHELACGAELRRHVRECIDRLPDRYRQILLLRDIEGLDTAEAASLLGVSEGVVKTRLHRARQALRTLLEPLMAEGGE
jgi:RNA polymerase sigma-70 factor (ECF subfamily)